ncbi:MAG: hypothetical protein ABR564_00170 [Candidatus Dormibacteria bacterium]
MNRRRQLAAVFLSAAMLGVLAVIVYVERVNATRTVTVYVVRGNVAGGALYGDDSVQPLAIRAEDNEFAHERRPPSELRARFATTLHAGDIVRTDDLVPLEEQVEIALTVTGSPPITAGDSIDLYATINGSSVLIGQRLRATSGGSPLTLLVPARDEAAWVAVSGSATPFHAIRASGGSAPSARSITTDQALRLLCGPACAQVGGIAP